MKKKFYDTCSLLQLKDLKAIGASAANGALAGAISGLAADIIAVTGGSAAVVVVAYGLAGAAGSCAGSLLESKINGEDMSSGKVWQEAGFSAAWGAAFGMLGGVTTGEVSSMIKDITKNAGQKALARGITFRYAAQKTFLKEIRPDHLLPSIVEEFGNNFNSWYTEFAVTNIFGGG